MGCSCHLWSAQGQIPAILPFYQVPVNLPSSTSRPQQIWVSLILTSHVGKGLTSGFFPKIGLKSHRVLLPVLLPQMDHARGKSPFAVPHTLLKTTSVSRFSTLGLLLAKRGQCWCFWVCWCCEGELGFPSAPVLVVVYEQRPLGWDGQRQNSVFLSPPLTWSMSYSQGQAH